MKWNQRGQIKQESRKGRTDSLKRQDWLSLSKITRGGVQVYKITDVKGMIVAGTNEIQSITGSFPTELENPRKISLQMLRTCQNYSNMK